MSPKSQDNQSTASSLLQTHPAHLNINNLVLDAIALWRALKGNRGAWTESNPRWHALKGNRVSETFEPQTIILLV